MSAGANNLKQLVDLFQPRTSRAVPLTKGEWLLIDTPELSETAALAVTLRLYLQQVGNRASCRRTKTGHAFYLIPKEEPYDRTL